ncbi:class I SAM-dependent methyltransferase [Paenibacillus sp. CGMCC 1.18879]|uniref:class I SAM-dependent methyltransferase n=1 Tax=Paenibacillus sp. CGMCC 1.18879 TaxID=2834466 RepID=UPI001CA98D26|nr:methyltransferase domain-containing protein [Paenibacillus sp. CGMCC 1.18879]MBY9078356.1 methyltransferase domain-containing protein [Paenibacillus sp. CGMCC 1.18879]
MNQQGSYQISTIASNIEKELERLRAQVDLFWDKELKHYKEYGLKDGMSVVEIGSGPGFLTEKILENFSSIQITSVEIDPLLVDYAKSYLTQKNHTRFEITQGSIMETGLPENSFDFALVRLLLEHLTDPIDAVREVLRILKPGGKAVFVDNDFEMHIITYPQILQLRELYDAYCKARYAEGGNPRIGRELPMLLKKGGFSKIDLEIICAHSEILGEGIFFKSEGIGIPTKLVQDGFLSSKALGEISIEWRNMIKSKEHSLVRQLYMAVGEKPL